MTRLILPPATDAEVHIQFARDGLRLRRHRSLYRHWLTCSGPSPFPDSTLALPDALPPDVLDFVEVVRLGKDGHPVIEYAGAGIEEITGIGFAGQRITDIPGGEDPDARMRWCFRFGVPYLVDAELVWRQYNFDRFSALVLPFGGDDGAVDKLVVGLEFYNDTCTGRRKSGQPDFPVVNADKHASGLKQP